MSRKIARITEDKKLLLGDEVIENNTRISLNDSGRLDVDEIIEYPPELEGGRNLISHNPDNWEQGSISNDTGENTQHNAIIRTKDFVEVDSASLIFKRHTQNHNFAISEYDKYKNLVRGWIDGGGWIWTYSKTSKRQLHPETKYLKFLIGGYTNAAWHNITPNVLDEINFKLEIGDQATPWTPAPEDLGFGYPDDIQSFEFGINDSNNIVTSEFIEGYPIAKPVIDDSLVLWLDGTTGNNYDKTNVWKDLSGNGNDGELVNFGYTEDSGWTKDGLKFDGVDDIVGVELKPSDFMGEDFARGSMSVELLAKPNSEHTYFLYGLTLGYLSVNKYNYLYLNHVKISGTRLDNYRINMPNHIVITINNGVECSIYCNGELEGHYTTDDGVLSTANNYLRIGHGYSSKFNGEFKIFRIYNRALTDEEILQNYQAGQCSPLLAMRGDIIG